jgi:hypothetical protein
LRMYAMINPALLSAKHSPALTNLSTQHITALPLLKLHSPTTQGQEPSRANNARVNSIQNQQQTVSASVLLPSGPHVCGMDEVVCKQSSTTQHSSASATVSQQPNTTAPAHAPSMPAQHKLTKHHVQEVPPSRLHLQPAVVPHVLALVQLRQQQQTSCACECDTNSAAG